MIGPSRPDNQITLNLVYEIFVPSRDFFDDKREEQASAHQQAHSYDLIRNITICAPPAAPYPAPVTAGAVTGFGDPRK